MKFEIKNRFTEAVQFTAEIDADNDNDNDNESYGFKCGLAVKWGIVNKANLENANLRGAYLVGAKLRGAKLRGANLESANLEDAYLEDAYLVETNLRGANLMRANLRGANLVGANLVGTNLMCANLRDANLMRANLEDAVGNKHEIRSMQLDTWNITFTKEVLQIGCQRHTHDEWKDFTDGEILEMSDSALEWWKKWKEFIFKAIELSFSK